MAKPATGSHKKGKKNRKWGRNKKSCERYRLEERREKNKARKAAKYARHMAKAATNKSNQ